MARRRLMPTQPAGAISHGASRETILRQCVRFANSPAMSRRKLKWARSSWISMASHAAQRYQPSPPHVVAARNPPRPPVLSSAECWQPSRRKRAVNIHRRSVSRRGILTWLVRCHVCCPRPATSALDFLHGQEKTKPQEKSSPRSQKKNKTRGERKEDIQTQF